MRKKTIRIRGFCKLCRLLKKATPECHHPTWHVFPADISVGEVLQQGTIRLTPKTRPRS